MTEEEHIAAPAGASHDRVASVDELETADTKVGGPRAGGHVCVCVCMHGHVYVCVQMCVCVCVFVHVYERERERERETNVYIYKHTHIVGIQSTVSPTCYRRCIPLISSLMYTTTVGEPVDMVSAGVVELMVTVKKRVPSVTKFAVVLMLQTLLVDPASRGRT